MLRSVLLITFLLGISVGCGNSQKGPPREETYPITGVVQFDGQPAENLKVTLHRESGQSLGAYTDASGNFSVGTYEAGDGAPVGTYKLTFMYGAINLMSGRYSGPDKLKGKYSDPEKSEYTATVSEGEPCDLGVIELTSK